MHSVGRQDAIEMLACRDAELDEPLVKVVLDRLRLANSWLSPDPRLRLRPESVGQ